MKHEWKKHEKELYNPGEVPQLLEVPAQKFFMIKGSGNPNDADFAERVGVLFPLAYAVKMLPKSGLIPQGYFEYTAYPLEGIWDAADINDKNTFTYTIMVRQPDFVTADIAQRAFETVRKKKPHRLLDEAYFQVMQDGLSVQLLHTGDYDQEPASFAIMNKFLAENRLVRKSNSHREIYLSDARKVQRQKLKTVLRYQVEYI